MFDSRDNTKAGGGGVPHGPDNYTATLGTPMLGEIYPEAQQPLEEVGAELFHEMLDSQRVQFDLWISLHG